MSKVIKSFCALLVLALAAPAASAADGFISAEELEARLSDYLVVDARTAPEYQAGHIAGAVNAPAAQVVALEKQGSAALTDYFGALGIDGIKAVAVYGAPFGAAPDGRVAFSLGLLGVEALILDGGFPA